MSNAKGSAQGTTSKVTGSQIKSANSMVHNQMPVVRSISACVPKSVTGQATDNKQMSSTHSRCSLKSVTTHTLKRSTNRPPTIDLTHSTCKSALIRESSKLSEAASLLSSVCSLPEFDDSDSGSHLELQRKTEGDKLQKKKIEFNKPRMNLVAQQRISCLKGQPPVKTFVRSASAHLKQDQKSLTRCPRQSALPVSSPRQRLIEPNQVRALEVLHKKLKDLQSDFMYKLRNIGPIGLSKLPCCYKFVATVINENCKLLVHEDELRHLPKNLPIESVNDLKDRFRAVLDNGFMLMYEQLPNIQLAKNNAESRKLREDLRTKLQSLLNRKLIEIITEIKDQCGTNDSKNDYAEHLNQLEAEFQTRLNEEIFNRDKQIDILKITMKQMEDKLTEQSLNLDENDIKDQSHIEINQLRSTNERMEQGLEDSHANLERAHKSIKNNVDRINYLELELKEARNFIVNLQKRPDAMDQGVVEKDLIINDLRTQIDKLEKQVKKHTVYEELIEDYAAAMTRMNDLQTQIKNSQAVIESQRMIKDQLRLQVDLGKEELHKTVLQVNQLQERAERDRQLLEARSEMISAMEEHVNDYQTRLNVLSS